MHSLMILVLVLFLGLAFEIHKPHESQQTIKYKKNNKRNQYKLGHCRHRLLNMLLKHLLWEMVGKFAHNFN